MMYISPEFSDSEIREFIELLIEKGICVACWSTSKLCTHGRELTMDEIFMGVIYDAIIANLNPTNLRPNLILKYKELLLSTIESRQIDNRSNTEWVIECINIIQKSENRMNVEF